MTIGSIDNQSNNTLTLRQTASRQTPVSAERSFGETLAAGGRALLQSAVSAASVLPGGNLLAAAVRGAALPSGVPQGAPPALGARGGADGAAQSAEGPTGDPTLAANTGNVSGASDGDMLARSQDMSMRMLQLQESMAEENRRYTTLSNVLHARHEMAKNAINNIR